MAIVLLACAALPGAGAAGGPRPGEPGFVAPWNRVTRDSVADLDPAVRAYRVELRGRLIAADGSPWRAGARAPDRPGDPAR